MRHAAAVRNAMAALAVLGWMSCGGGGSGGSGGPTSHPPTLSNLVMAPAATYQGASGDSKTVSASLNFADAGGDLDSLALQIKDGTGTTLQSLSTPITGAAGVTSGTLSGQITVSTGLADTYTFHFTVSDKLASISNALSGTFRVAPPPVASLPAMPSPRARVAGAALGGLVYTLGGGDDYGNHFTTVEAFDPATGIWSAKPPMSIPRDAAVAGVIGGRLYVAAGGLSRAAERFDPATGAWSPIAPLPTERNGATGCEVNGRLYVVGGNQGLDLSTVEAYDPSADAWTTCAPIPVARSWAGACALNGKLYVVGGYATTAAVSPWLDRLDIYDPATDTWSAGPPIPISLGIYQHVVLALNGQVVVFGGGNANRALDTIYRYDPATHAWTQGVTMPRAMSQFGGAVAAGQGYLFDATGTLCYDPVKDLGPLP